MTTLRSNLSKIGFDHDVTLESLWLRVRTRPSCGAKLIELRSLRTGRDWLWKNPRQMIRQGKPFADYVGEFDSGGWDELFPNVSPVPSGADLEYWGRDGLTDHGELWFRSWESEQADKRHCLQSVWPAPDGFRFQRGMCVDARAARLRCSYEVENLSGVSMPFVWAAHPLFRCGPGMSLDIRRDCPIESVQCHGVAFDRIPSRGCWGDLVDRFLCLGSEAGWSHEDLHCGLTLKVFLRTEAGSPVSLIDRESGERLTVSHDGGDVTHTAVWLNLGGWSGDRGDRHCNVGLEPTTYPADVPPADSPPAALLEPGERRVWSISVSIDRL